MATAATAEGEPITGAPEALFRPGERRAAWIGVAVAAVAFLLLATGGRPWELFDRGPFTSDFYDAQARAVAHGHLDVPAEVAGIEGFAVDGRTQLYFGIGPALPRLPLTGWSDALDGRLALLSQLGAVVVLGTAAARLLARARRLVPGAPEGRPWWFAVAGGAPTLATPVLFLAARPLVYHEAALWGAAAGLAGLDLALRWREQPSTRRLVEAGLVATFAMACRPPTGAAPAVALGLFALLELRRRDWRRATALATCAIVPLLAFAAVNHARFGSPVDVPFPDQVISRISEARQEALAANDGSLFGAAFVPTTLARYLSPTAVVPQRLFPFVGWGDPAPVVGDATFESIDHAGSLVSGAPALGVLALAGAWWTLRRARGRDWRVVAVAAATPVVLTLAISTVAHRYLVDFVPALVVLAAPAVWVWARAVPGWPRGARRAGVAAMAVLALAGAWTQVALALQARSFSMLPTRQELLDLARFQYDLDDALFGGAPPNVRAAEGEELPEAGDGDLVVLDRCGGLYRFDGYGWGALERAPGGGRRLLLEGDAPTGATEVAHGAGWSLELVPGADGATVVHHVDGRPDVVSDPFPLRDGAVVLDVVADPATDEVEVAVDGEVVFSALYVPASGLTAGAGWSTTRAGTDLCASLLERLEG